jgi:predicted nucleic acid-binding protein
VTEADDVLFGRAEMERAFTALGERLARRGVVADVFVVGGAAMALAYDATRVTRDIDDLRVLADIIGVESAEEALQICAEFYPDEPVPQRSVAVLRELFG